MSVQSSFKTRKLSGFTLIEILVVIAILAIIVAILVPVIMRAKNSAKQSSCIQNLRQIGQAFTMYMNDYDDRWPLGLDPADKYTPQIWASFPDFYTQIPYLPLMHDLLRAYVESREIWHCPADKGQEIDDVSFELLYASPSSFAQFGTSYYYRTELTVKQFMGTSVQNLAEINVYFDGSGAWHTSKQLLLKDESVSEWIEKLRDYRYNVLYGDMHVKNVPRDQYWDAWMTDL